MPTPSRADAARLVAGLTRWLRDVRPVYLLLPLSLIQIGIGIAFALSVQHNGWLWYSGGDATEYWAEQWSVGHGLLPHTFLSFVLPVAFAWVPLLWGPTLLTGIPAIVVVQVMIGIPLTLVGVWAVADRVAGRLFAWWTTFLWIVSPLLFVWGLRSDYRGQFEQYFLVPHWFGFTDMADFWSVAVALWSAWAVFRALDSRRLEHAALAGLFIGALIGLKPANSLFLPAALLGLVILQRWRQLLVAAVAAAPAIATLVLWKQKGIGQLPVLALDGPAVREASGPNLVAVSFSNHYLHFDWAHVATKLSQIGEVFWSVRLLEFLAIAGAFALVRRSPLKGTCVVLWFAAFCILKGNSPLADVPETSYWRLTQPGLAAFVLLAAAIPLLVPGLGRRLSAVVPASPGRFRATPGLIVAVALLAVLPLVVVAIATPMSSPKVARNSDNTEAPVSTALGFSAHPASGGVQLSWRSIPTGSVQARFAVYRSNLNDGCEVQSIGARECFFDMPTVTTTSSLSATDRPGPGRWWYRVSLIASQDRTAENGDLMLLSPAVEVTTK